MDTHYFSYFKLIKYLDVKEINIFLLCVFENFISCNKGNLFPLFTNLNKKNKIHSEWLIDELFLHYTFNKVQQLLSRI